MTEPETSDAGSTPGSTPGSTAPLRNPQDRRGYWVANLRLIAVLLTVWAVVSYGCSVLFIEQLNEYTIGAVPLGFWFAQQGSIYVFVALILIYAWRMDRLDRKYGVEE